LCTKKHIFFYAMWRYKCTIITPMYICRTNLIHLLETFSEGVWNLKMPLLDTALLIIKMWPKFLLSLLRDDRLRTQVMLCSYIFIYLIRIFVYILLPGYFSGYFIKYTGYLIREYIYNTVT